MTKVENLRQLSLSLNSGTVGTPNIELNAIMKKCFQPMRCLREGNQRSCIHFTQPRVLRGYGSLFHIGSCLIRLTALFSRTIAAGLI